LGGAGEFTPERAKGALLGGGGLFAEMDGVTPAWADAPDAEKSKSNTNNVSPKADRWAPPLREQRMSVPTSCK
jgi:hypothetical protein